VRNRETAGRKARTLGLGDIAEGRPPESMRGLQHSSSLRKHRSCTGRVII
jgi:hypothetical protein